MEDLTQGVVAPVTSGDAPTQAITDTAPAETVEGLQGQPEAQQESEKWIELPTGSRYRTQEDLIRGKVEADFAIARLQAELNAAKAQSFQQPQPQQDVHSQNDAEIAAMASKLEASLLRNPQFANADRNAIREEAYIRAVAAYEIKQQTSQETRSLIEQQIREQEHNKFVEAHASDLNSDIGAFVYERAKSMGQPFLNPQAHLDATHAEMFRRGIAPKQTTASMGALNAARNSGQIFATGSPGMGANQPQATPMAPHVLNAVEAAKARGATEADLVRVRQIAENMNVSAFSRGVSR